MGMTDMQKIIKGLENQLDDLTKYADSDEVFTLTQDQAKDILALLKKQEPIKPTINEYGEAYCICGENVGIIPSSKNLPKICSKYCSRCGRRIKWE